MGLLVTKLWKLWWSDKEHKVVIIGLDNAGKTTILYSFVTGEVIHTSPTIGSNVEQFTWRNIAFSMWDIGGQETYRATWSTYYTQAEVVIVVIDSTDKKRLPVIKEEIYKLLAHEALQKASILIYANKQDIKGAMTAAEISTELNLTAIKTHQWHIQACSALTGVGVQKGLEWIASHIP